MPSEVLNAETDYQFPPSPAPAYLDRETWNAVLASLSSRLRSLEDVSAGIEAIKNELSTLGISIINDAITPLIDDVGMQLAALQGTVTDIEQQAQAMLADLANAIDAMQIAIDEILSGTLPAENVSVAEIPGLTSATAQAAFAEIVAAIAATAQAAADNLDVHATAESVHAEARASQQDAEGGTVDNKWMSPLGAAQAIAALAGDVVREVFTESSTFTKEDDDFAYLVQMVGGGGSGGKGIESGSRVLGGSAGEIVEYFFTAAELPVSVAVTIGSGGAPVSASGPGNDGGNTTFGNLLVARGGKGGRVGGTTGNNSMAPWALGAGWASSGVVGNGTGAGTYCTAQTNGDDVGGQTSIGPTPGASTGTSGSSTWSAATSLVWGSGGASRGSSSGGSNAEDGQPGGGGGGAAHFGAGNSGAGGRGEVRIIRFKRIKQ